MTNYYATSADYHDALDRAEARERAERIDREMDEAKKSPVCACYEYQGDNPECPEHGENGSDNRVSTQIREYLDSQVMK